MKSHDSQLAHSPTHHDAEGVPTTKEAASQHWNERGEEPSAVLAPAPVPPTLDPPAPEEEREEARLERLGRERPKIFKTAWAEIAFAYSIVASMMMSVCYVMSQSLPPGK